MNAVELKNIRTSFEKMTIGKTFEGRPKQLVFSINRQLENADRLTRRGRPLSAVEKKLLLEDVAELEALLSTDSRGDAGVSP